MGSPKGSIGVSRVLGFLGLCSRVLGFGVLERGFLKDEMKPKGFKVHMPYSKTIGLFAVI